MSWSAVLYKKVLTWISPPLLPPPAPPTPPRHQDPEAEGVPAETFTNLVHEPMDFGRIAAKLLRSVECPLEIASEGNGKHDDSRADATGGTAEGQVLILCSFSCASPFDFFAITHQTMSCLIV